jgi:hypothetical protein
MNSDADDYAAVAAYRCIVNEFLFFYFFSLDPASYVEGLSLTTSLRYQDSRLEIS